MEENERLYPVSEEVFNRKILPVIEESYIWKGRPPKVTHYKYGYRHVVYDRFSRGSKRGLWAKILLSLQERKEPRGISTKFHAVISGCAVIAAVAMTGKRYKKRGLIERLFGKLKENRRPLSAMRNPT